MHRKYYINKLPTVNQYSLHNNVRCMSQFGRLWPYCHSRKKNGKTGNQILKIANCSFTFHSNNVPIYLLITARTDKAAFATDFTKCCFSSFFTENMEI